MYYSSYYIFIIPALILSLFAQSLVSSTFEKYRKIGNRKGITGADAARAILNRNGLADVKIERVAGNLTDHYDPKARTIRLSDSVYNSTSVSAVGVAAHEVGHAIQHDRAYAPIKVRNTILPVAQISSQIAIPLVILGMFISAFQGLITFGILLFTAVVLFQIITLPVEFNASSRAISTIYEMGILTNEETQGAKKVLRAAALTYVAAAAVSIMQLLRLIAMSSGRRRD